MHLIGVNGFKRSGKGTVANIVSALYGDGEANVVQVGFADKLKILGAKALGFTDAPDAYCIALMDAAKESWTIDIRSHVKGEAGPTPSPGRLSPGWTTTQPVTNLTGRQYLQNIGNEARGLFGDTFWIDMVLPPTRAAYEGWEDQVQEAYDRMMANMYPDTDAVVITDLRYENEAQRVKALGGVVWEVLRPGTDSDGHASEVPLPRELVDWQIRNEWGLKELEHEVESAMTGTLR